MNIQKEVSHRISIIRFVMIFGVVLLHTPPAVQMVNVSSGWFNFIQAIFQNGVFRMTVPILTVVSGYLLFSSGLDQFPRKLLTKKVQAVLVPFLVFNLSLLAVVYFIQLKTHESFMYSVYLPKASMSTWLGAALALSDKTAPINYPLWFLRDLMALMVMAPALGFLLRNFMVLGLIFVSVFFMTNCDGGFLGSNELAILFYLGGVAAVGNWKVMALDQFAIPLAVIFFALCMLMVLFRVANFTYLGFASPFLIWPAISLIANTKLGNWLAHMSKYSFFIYLAHAPVVAVLFKLYQQRFSTIPVPLFWVVTPVITTITLVAVYKLAMRITPFAFSTITGCRNKRPQGVLVTPLPAGEVA